MRVEISSHAEKRLVMRKIPKDMVINTLEIIPCLTKKSGIL